MIATCLLSDIAHGCLEANMPAPIVSDLPLCEQLIWSETEGGMIGQQQFITDSPPEVSDESVGEARHDRSMTQSHLPKTFGCEALDGVFEAMNRRIERFRKRSWIEVSLNGCC